MQHQYLQSKATDAPEASFLGQSSFGCRVLFAKAWKGTKGTLLFLYFRTLHGEGGELAMFLLQLCLSKQTSNRVSTMPFSLSLWLLGIAKWKDGVMILNWSCLDPTQMQLSPSYLHFRHKPRSLFWKQMLPSLSDCSMWFDIQRYNMKRSFHTALPSPSGKILCHRSVTTI